MSETPIEETTTPSPAAVPPVEPTPSEVVIP